jgi:hypothetical protein
VISKPESLGFQDVQVFFLEKSRQKLDKNVDQASWGHFELKSKGPYQYDASWLAPAFQRCNQYGYSSPMPIKRWMDFSAKKRRISMINGLVSGKIYRKTHENPIFNWKIYGFL